VKTAPLFGLAAAIVALALVPGRQRGRERPDLAEPRVHARALSLDDMERLRRARRALIDAERTHLPPVLPVGHSE